MNAETTTGERTDGPLENWLLLMDPAWQPVKENDAPPLEAVVGLWPVEEEGHIGKFRANPDYRPSDERSPSDPLDAVLRLVLRGKGKVEQIQVMLRDTLLDVAMNGDGRPLMMKSPDDISCVIVASGEPHRVRVPAPDWRRTDLEGVVELLADGVDVLFNPGGPASVRLTGDFIRETTLLDEAEVAEIFEQYRETGELRMGLWEVPATGTAHTEENTTT